MVPLETENAHVQDAPVGNPVQTLLYRVNGIWHKPVMLTFATVVILHWLEHIVQAVQVWAFGMPPAEALGALGYAWPWLVSSEWLHYGYAITMLLGLLLLWPGMTGRARLWWGIAFWIQAWHHVEHLVLIVQAQTGTFWFGAAGPTSFAQLVVPRVELHLIYNALVTFPMIIGMAYHVHPSPAERVGVRCACAGH